MADDGDWQIVRRRRKGNSLPVQLKSQGKIPTSSFNASVLYVSEEQADVKKKKKKKKVKELQNQVAEDKVILVTNEEKPIKEGECVVTPPISTQPVLVGIQKFIIWDYILSWFAWFSFFFVSKRELPPLQEEPTEASHSEESKNDTFSVESKKESIEQKVSKPTNILNQKCAKASSSLANPLEASQAALKSSKKDSSSKEPELRKGKGQITDIKSAGDIQEAVKIIETTNKNKKVAPTVLNSKDEKGEAWQLFPFDDIHLDVVSAVAIADDIILSAGYDTVVKVGNWQEGKAPVFVSTLRGHSSRVEAVALSKSGRAASAGRDSALKIWSVSNAGASCKEVASYYVYETVRSMVVAWEDHWAALGCGSGAVMLMDIETGKRRGMLKGHSDEVSAIAHATSMRLLMSGSRDRTVRLWDDRSSGNLDALAVFTGLRGRVCSLATNDHLLFVGDVSSGIKVFDLRAISSSASAPMSAGGCPTFRPASTLGNAPVVAGDACPVAGLKWLSGREMLISSGVGWWSENTEVLEEAPESATMPVACLNTFRSSKPADPASLKYSSTLRLREGLVTSIDADSSGSRMLVGLSSGQVLALAEEKSGKGDVLVCSDGVEVFSDDEDDGADDDDDSGEDDD